MLDDALVLADRIGKTVSSVVLILVVLDDALVQYFLIFLWTYSARVLILVVLDDALVLLETLVMTKPYSLNPCCAGRCSSTDGVSNGWLVSEIDVLILVVLDDALVP